MNDDLLELLARLNWARDEVKTVDTDIAAWNKRSCKLSVALSDHPGFRDIIVTVSEEIPLAVRARSGTIANEIRACLDGLTSELAARNDKTGAYFPIADHEDEFTTDKRLRERLRKFREADRDALLALRPFAVGTDGKPGNLLLYGLHHADVKRKHHSLVAKSSGGAFSFHGIIGQFIRDVAYVDCPGKTKIARVSHDSDLELKFQPIIQYAEPNILRDRPLVETLNEFADVAEAAVRTFL